MTIREAVDTGVRNVRLPEWNASAFLSLPLRKLDGIIEAPWAFLHDDISTPGIQHPLLVSELLKETCDRYEKAGP